MASVRELKATTRPPKVKYPDWLTEVIENPNRLSELTPEAFDVSQVWRGRPTAGPRDFLELEYGPGDPIPRVPEIKLTPQHPVNVRVFLSTKNPNPLLFFRVNPKGETNQSGIYTEMVYEGHTIEISTGKEGYTQSNGMLEPENLIPFVSSIKISKPTTLDIFAKNGACQDRSNGQWYYASNPYQKLSGSDMDVNPHLVRG